MRLALILFSSLALLLSAAKPAHADEALLERLEKAESEDDINGSIKAIHAVKTAWDKLDKKAQKSAVKILEDMAENEDLGKARKDAVEIFEHILDEKEAWKVLKKLWPDRKADEASETDLSVLTVVGKRKIEKAIKPLMELAEKARSDSVAARAILVLGMFKGEIKQRVKIVKAIMEAALKSEYSPPAPGSGKNPSQSAYDRWKIMEPAILQSLNHLTNEKIKDWAVWKDAYKHNERKLQKLFLPDPEPTAKKTN